MAKSSVSHSDERLAYQVHAHTGGHADAPHLLLLHGFLSSSAQWLHNVDALSQVCTPVTVELWGHGDSPAPEDAALYHPLAYVDQFERIRAELGCERWFVFGYSLGAGLVMRYAHTYPERVYGQICSNSQSGFADDDLIRQWREGADETSRRLLEGGMAAIRRIPVHPRFAKRLPKDVYDALAADAERVSPLGIANTMRLTNPHVSTRDFITETRLPSLLCFGKHEKRFYASKAWAEQNVPNLQVIELDAGHAVNMEDAPGFNAAVAAFIGTHGPTH